MMKDAQEQENDNSVYNSTANVAKWIGLLHIFSWHTSLLLAADLLTRICFC